MTKAEIVNEIVSKTSIEKSSVQAVVEATMESIKSGLVNGENIYLRRFGTFHLKKRAEKLGRIISRNTPIRIPAHNVPAFKPAKEFLNEIKTRVAVK